MKLSSLKAFLDSANELEILLPNGNHIPSHFHITEIGIINKVYIDCGGTMRKESKASMQVWVAEDTDHRLLPSKLSQIINIAESSIDFGDPELEVEYQGETIGKYALETANGQLRLMNTQTDCLAKDNCGIPAQKPKLRLSEIGSKAASQCAPGSGCC